MSKTTTVASLDDADFDLIMELLNWGLAESTHSDFIKRAEKLKSKLQNARTTDNEQPRSATNDEIREAFESTEYHRKPYGTTDGYINTLKANLFLFGMRIVKG